MALSHGGHFGQLNGVAAPVDAFVQRQRMLTNLNETTWQRIGMFDGLEQGIALTLDRKSE